MTDVHFTRMHRGQKTFQKANWRLLKSIREAVIFFALSKFYLLGCFYWYRFHLCLLDTRNAFW